MRLIIKILFAFISITFISCDGDKEYPWNPDWDQYQPEPEPDPEPGPAPDDTITTEKPDTSQTPEPPVVDPEPPVEDPDPEPDPQNGKARLVWIDAAANFEDYGNDADRIASDMARIKDTGFTGVIVEVRPTTAGLLFESDVEAALDRVDAWTDHGYDWVYRHLLMLERRMALMCMQPSIRW